MPRRTSGEGSIYQDKSSGLWRAEITIGFDGNNKRITKKKSSKSLEVVQKWLNEENCRLSRGVNVKGSDYTLGSWLEFWLENYKRPAIKARTFDLYEKMVKWYILPNYGNIRLAKLKGEVIQSLYNDMYKKGLSTSTIKNVKAPLSQALDQAVKNELIYSNPCKNAVVPKVPPRKSRAFTVEEQERFLEVLTDTTFADFFRFAFKTGMRCGEIMAVTWKDVDFTESKLIINKTASVVEDRSEDRKTKYKTILDLPKSDKSNRVIDINKGAMKILKDRKEKSNGCLFVFPSQNDTPLQYRNVRRSFNEFLEKAEVPNDLTIHSTRHSFATRLLERGANIKAVSEILGHNSIQITLDTYGHVMPSFKKETMNLLDD
jgi:integrase